MANLAPKWKRRRRRLEVLRTRETNRIEPEGWPYEEPRRSPLARALFRGWRQGDPFLLFLAAPWHAVYGDDPRKRLVGLSHFYRGDMSPEWIDRELDGMKVRRGARCRYCRKVLIVRHRSVAWGVGGRWATCGSCWEPINTTPVESPWAVGVSPPGAPS